MTDRKAPLAGSLWLYEQPCEWSLRSHRIVFDPESWSAYQGVVTIRLTPRLSNHERAMPGLAAVLRRFAHITATEFWAAVAAGELIELKFERPGAAEAEALLDRIMPASRLETDMPE